jgi:putative restriction endonuclease
LDNLKKYLQAFKNLHVDRSHGVAPHKPILLLSVLQSFQYQQIVTNRIPITAELVALFKTNWSSLVRTNHDCRISYPFYYLKSDRFWKLIPKGGFENFDQLGSVMKSFSSLVAIIDCAVLDNDLFILMNDKKSNIILQQFLLQTYFPDTKDNFIATVNGQYQILNDIKEKILKEDQIDYKKEILDLLEQKDEEEIYLRGSLFKREIPKIYNNTCCISGMRIDSETSVSMIDACHIIPFSKSYNDTISNGIALCPNLHRAYDRGLISIDQDYKVVVSKNFKEYDTNYSLKRFEGQKILLPKEERFYPLQANIDWHKKNIFRVNLENGLLDLGSG